MVSRDKLDGQLQEFDFDSLACKQPDAQRRLRLLGLAHFLKEGKSYVAVAQSLRVTRHAVMQWVNWFAADGIARLSGSAKGGDRPDSGKSSKKRCAVPSSRPKMRGAVAGFGAKRSGNCCTLGDVVIGAEGGIAMRRPWLLLCVGGLFGTSAALGADGGGHAVKQAVIPGGSTIVVVAEGDFEPRSIGSYSVRAYGAANPRFPFDDFIAGTIRPRDGTIDHIRFSDLDRDGSPEIVVVIRSVGTGAQLSADAFQLRGTVLMLLDTVSNLAKDADPIRALKAKLTHRAEPRTAPDRDKSRR